MPAGRITFSQNFSSAEVAVETRHGEIGWEYHSIFFVITENLSRIHPLRATKRAVTLYHHLFGD
jgi:hypothetical protein